MHEGFKLQPSYTQHSLTKLFWGDQYQPPWICRAESFIENQNHYHSFKTNAWKLKTDAFQTYFQVPPSGTATSETAKPDGFYVSGLLFSVLLQGHSTLSSLHQMVHQPEG